MLCQAWLCTGSDVTLEAGSGGSLLWPHHGGEETTVQHGRLLLHLPLQAKLRGAAHQKHIFVSTYKQLTQRFFPLLTIQNIKITFLEVPVLVKPLARGFFSFHLLYSNAKTNEYRTSCLSSNYVETYNFNIPLLCIQ